MILIFALLLVSAGAFFWVRARHQLLKHLAQSYPELWSELGGSHSTEIRGYSAKLTVWVSSKEYLSLGDNELTSKAVHYQNIKFVCLPIILLGIAALFIGVQSGS